MAAQHFLEDFVSLSFFVFDDHAASRRGQKAWSLGSSICNSSELGGC
jgi:hypothetical protein